MNCKWCTNEAVQAGTRPQGTSGPDHLFACELHANKIEKLRYVPANLNEIISEQRRQEVLQKRAK